MRKQTGARYLHKNKNRKDETFIGTIKVANPKMHIRLPSGALKRTHHKYE